VRMHSARARLRPSTDTAAAFAGAPRPARDTPWREASWCALDLELTGLDPGSDQIVAIGAVPIEDGRPILAEALYTRVRAAKRSSPRALMIHGLDAADLAGAPVLEQALDRVVELLAGRVPVFHTAAVERVFLGRALRAAGVALPAAADTEALGRLWLAARDGSAPRWLGLDALARALGHPDARRHHALSDALTAANAFIALAEHLDVRRPQTVGSLVRAGDRLGSGRRLGPC
jgi:DNA polymerase-3 subunit epsilon